MTQNLACGEDLTMCFWEPIYAASVYGGGESCGGSGDSERVIRNSDWLDVASVTGNIRSSLGWFMAL